MPERFTVEVARSVPSRRLTVHHATSVDQACEAAIRDDTWRDSDTDDPANVGHTFVSGVWAGTNAGDCDESLPFSTRWHDRRQRRSDHFPELMQALKIAMRRTHLPIEVHAAFAKGEAILADVPDPDGPHIVRTPWGTADCATVYCHGITFYSNSEHGGFFLDPEANSEMPEKWRENNGWYEEDQRWARVAVTFSHFFPQEEVDKAGEIVAREERAST